MLPLPMIAEKSLGGEFVFALVAQPALLFRLVNGDNVFVAELFFEKGPFARGTVEDGTVDIVRRVFKLEMMFQGGGDGTPADGAMAAPHDVVGMLLGHVTKRLVSAQ